MCGRTNKGSVWTSGCKQQAKESHFEFFFFFRRWLMALSCSTGVWRPSRVFVCLREPVGNAAVGQSSKHSQHGYVDALYLMDRPLRKHSLERAAEKCLTHIGGMLLTGDVCKQQPSPCVVVGVRCERPRGPYRMGVVRKTRSRCNHVFGISKRLHLICQPTRKAILFSCRSRKVICLPQVQQLLTPMTP